MNHPEDDLQMTVVGYLDRCLSPDVFWCHIPNGGSRVTKQNKQGKTWSPEATRLKKMGVKPGVGDLLFLHDGKPAFIELKAPGGTPSPSQKLFRAVMDRQGIPYAICQSLDHVIRKLDEWQIPTRGRLGV